LPGDTVADSLRNEECSLSVAALHLCAESDAHDFDFHQNVSGKTFSALMELSQIDDVSGNGFGAMLR